MRGALWGAVLGHAAEQSPRPEGRELSVQYPFVNNRDVRAFIMEYYT